MCIFAVDEWGKSLHRGDGKLEKVLMMRKKIFLCVAIVIAAISLVGIRMMREIQARPVTLGTIEALTASEKGPDDPFWCETCGACTGTYYICRSEYENFWNNISSNCGPESDILVYFVEGC